MENSTRYREQTENDRSPAETVERLEHDIEGIRDNLGKMVGDLGHRRHQIFSLRLQWRRHPARLVMLAAALTAVVAGGISLRRARAARLRPTGLARLRQLGRGLGTGAKSLRVPRTQAPMPSIAWRVLTAGAAGAASVVGKRLAQDFIKSQTDVLRQDVWSSRGTG